MGNQKEEEQDKEESGQPEKQQNSQPKSSSSSLRSKAAHFVSDLTTVLLNPISDRPSSKPKPLPFPEEELDVDDDDRLDSVPEEGPDTSSFTAFLYSLLSSTESGGNSKSNGSHEDVPEPPEIVMRESSKRKSLFSRGKHSLGKAIHQAARLGGFRSQGSSRSSLDMTIDGGSNSKVSRDDRIPTQTLNEPQPEENLPETSEPSSLLSEKTRGALYKALPTLVQGRKWVLLYGTWRHGISLSTLYRRSMLWPGLSLLVVGDRKGAVFGGLVEAPLRPTTKRRYQGSNSSFVFTNISGRPVIFRPTGANRYFTLCSTEYIALGGGNHFALYLDGELLSGSSSASETYGNSCLAHTEDFEVKEVELWGFVYASKYEEMVSLLRLEAPGICRW